MTPSLPDLLVACLHQDGPRLTPAEAAALPPATWEALLALAAAQRVRPLLYERLASPALRAAVPPGTLAALHAQRQRITMRNLQRYGELRALASRFEQEGIPLIPLKGVYLAEAVYGNIALREMNDMDLLVPRSLVARAARVAEESGYRPLEPYDVEVYVAASQHVARLFKGPNGGIEIHWNLTRPGEAYSIDPGELWERAAPATLAGTRLLVLAPEDLLLHLCHHTSYHHQFAFGLRPSCDIAVLIAHSGETLAWETVARRARRWGWERGVYLALRLARDTVGAAVPEGVLRALRPRDFDDSLARTARDHLFTDPQVAGAIPPALAWQWEQPSLWGRVSAFWKRVFLPAPVIARQYTLPPGSRRLYLYYLVRLKDVLTRHARTAWRLRQGDEEELQGLLHRRARLAAWLARRD